MLLQFVELLFCAFDTPARDAYGTEDMGQIKGWMLQTSTGAAWAKVQRSPLFYAKHIQEGPRQGQAEQSCYRGTSPNLERIIKEISV